MIYLSLLSDYIEQSTKIELFFRSIMHFDPIQGRDTSREDFPVLEPKEDTLKQYIGKRFYDDYYDEYLEVNRKKSWKHRICHALYLNFLACHTSKKYCWCKKMYRRIRNFQDEWNGSRNERRFHRFFFSRIVWSSKVKSYSDELFAPGS